MATVPFLGPIEIIDLKAEGVQQHPLAAQSGRDTEPVIESGGLQDLDFTVFGLCGYI